MINITPITTEEVLQMKLEDLAMRFTVPVTYKQTQKTKKGNVTSYEYLLLAEDNPPIPFKLHINPESTTSHCTFESDVAF